MKSTLYKPDFKLLADGNDISEIIAKNLISLTLTDKVGTESDRLSIGLSWPSNHKTPSKGAVLKLSIGFNGQLVDKGQFVVDEITISGPPRRLQIVANAAPMDNTKQLGTLQTHKTRSWDNVTLNDVLKTVANEHGLTPKMSGSLTTVIIEHIDQVNESDMSLMTRLSKQYGAISKPANGYWLLLKEGEGTSVSGKVLPSFTITREMVSNWNYRESSRNESKRVVATYHDVESGEAKEVSVGVGEPAFRILFKYPNYEEAEAAVVARYRKVDSSKNNLDLTIVGTPEVLAISPESTLHVSGVGDAEDTDWIVNSLESSLSASGLTLRISCMGSNS